MKEFIIKWIKKYAENTNMEYAVIGISGGKDSTVAAKLLAEALGPEHVIGVSIPNGEQKDMADVDKVFEVTGIIRKTVNIHDAFVALMSGFLNVKDHEVKDMSRITSNTPARLRMTVLYMMAAAYPNARVVNTCNWSEDAIGWATKFGDAAGDFSLFAEFTKTEVVQIGEELGLPDELVHKIPDDGMCGKSDEEKFGFTYEELDNYILYSKIGPNVDKIEAMINNPNTALKIIPMPHPERKAAYAYDILTGAFKGGHR